MKTRTTVEIVQTALEMVADGGEFSTSALITRIDSQLSKPEMETVLLHLQEFGWIQKSNEEPSVWMKGPSSIEYLKSSGNDSSAFRVLPDEVPKEEKSR